VIDWEFGKPRGSPFVDPTNFLLTLAIETFDDFDRALEIVFCEDTPYSRAMENELERYTDRVGLTLEAVIVNLPAGISHRVAVNAAHPTALSMVTIPTTWRGWLETLADRYPAIVDRFMDRSTTR